MDLRGKNIDHIYSTDEAICTVSNLGNTSGGPRNYLVYFYREGECKNIRKRKKIIKWLHNNIILDIDREKGGDYYKTVLSYIPMNSHSKSFAVLPL